MAWLISLFDPDLEDKIAVGLSYSFERNSFMVHSNGDYDWTDGDLFEAGTLCDRAEVIGYPLAKRVFAFVDEIWIHDPWIVSYVGPSNGG